VEKPQISAVEAAGASGRPTGIERVKARAGKPKDVVWGDNDEAIRQSLVRQGEVWRALLSGEKPGTANLELQDYFATGARP
jgi:hypothetical protein